MSGSRACALVFLVAIAAHAGTPRAQERLSLRWLWHEEEHDSAYTVSEERRDWLVRVRGYTDMGTLAYVDAQPSPHARALLCFYSGAPRTDTFCSISPLAHRIVRKLGYETIGVEGYVQRKRVPGSVALFGVSRPYGDGADREHRFVIDPDELVRLRKEGWTYDGAQGFVYPP